MSIWNDSAKAEEWSQDPLSNNPLRQDQLDMLLTIIRETYQSGKTILDLGFGSGLVEERLFRRVKDAYVIGVDSSPAMVDLAQQRLAHFKDQYTAFQHDLRDIEALNLPSRDYQIAISVQTLHHLEDPDKRRVIRHVHKLLEPKGSFFILDRLAIESARLFEMYKVLWTRIDQRRGSRQAAHEGQSLQAHQSARREAGDEPASLVEHLNWLEEAGFEATCLHLHANRGLLVGAKG